MARATGGQRAGRDRIGSRGRMGVMDRIRRLSRAQHEALRAIDREEQNAIELENLEADHIAAEEAYLRRKDRLLGHEVPDVYQEIETARTPPRARRCAARQERFEALRVAVLTGPRRGAGRADAARAAADLIDAAPRCAALRPPPAAA